jgi:hypothetical protein
MASLAALSVGTTPYVRRRPELSPLYQLVLQHLESFVANEDVPAFAVRALRKFLTCGVLSEGFARVRCPECHEENLVAFSCKDRGFCPSCMSRRAAQTAANLIDFVLPSQPLRQWVFVLPFDLHSRVSRDPALESAVLGLFIEELTAHLRAVTGTEEPLGQAGTISVSQKFGSSINLHVHWHVLALDGVYTRDTDAAPLRFVRAPPPTVDPLEQLVQRVAFRVRELVGRAGPEPDLPEMQAPLLRVYGTEPAESVESVTPKLVASYDGFNLHAATAFEGHERTAIERWCRYALRGPLAASRLSLGPRNTVVYELAKPKPDGTTQLVFPVQSFLRRLCAVLPLPRQHTIVYHGVFASAHAWRADVVESVPKPTQPGLCPRKKRWIDWADLLRRVWAWEVLACSCGGTRRLMATIPKGPIAEKILKHLKLPTVTPVLGRATLLAQTEFWETGPPADDYRQAPAPNDFDQRLAECESPD